MSEVRNRNGEVIGRIEDNGNGTTYVYNDRGEINGKCEGGATYNREGEVVSYSENPGMLINQD